MAGPVDGWQGLQAGPRPVFGVLWRESGRLGRAFPFRRSLPGEIHGQAGRKRVAARGERAAGNRRGMGRVQDLVTRQIEPQQDIPALPSRHRMEGVSTMAISVTTDGNLRHGPAKLGARSCKVTLLLDPAAVLAALKQHAQAAGDRVAVVVQVDGRSLTASINAKSVRKTVSAIRDQGPDGVAVIIQGRLMDDNSIAECGLVAQPKIRKPEAAAAA
jgi:hypothetical protein